MQTANPNEPLRAAYIAKLNEATGLPIWAKLKPKNTPNEGQYLLIQAQTKNRTEISKNIQGAVHVANNFEWRSTINVEIININASGYAKPSVNDAVEQQVTNAIYAGLQVDGFQVKSYDLTNSIDLDISTDDLYIERRVITFEHWLCQE